MPWPVYSTRFIALNGPVMWVAYAVPANKRAVVRAVSVTSRAPAPALYMLSLAGRLVAQRSFQAADTSVELDTRQVLYAGETISVYLEKADMSCTVSGYLFDDPTGGLAGAQLPAPIIDPPDTTPG